jgi:cytochrome c553
MKLGTSKFGLLACAAVVVVGIVAFVVGFLILPSADAPATLWQRMCRAAGIVAPRSPTADQYAAPLHTHVVMPRAATTPGTKLEIQRGAALASRCSACHGVKATGNTAFPYLAGQYVEVIYKQLLDFHNGSRVNAIMAAMSASLSEENMLDLAHYYSSLSRPSDASFSQAPALVRVGDPMRSIAPCLSCHGAKDGKTGAPDLGGQPQSYLQEQLTAFAQGTRSNDQIEIMRGEAHRLTAGEITQLTEYYAGSRP